MSQPTTTSSFLVPGRRMLHIAVCALAALLAYTALPAISDDEPRDTDYEKGMAADEEKDYELAAKSFQKSAERGNPNAQYKLAKYYANGQGVKEDPAEAVKWYRKAAEQGHADAQNYLGVAYFYGEGVEKNQEEAVKWLLKAAESGSDVAQNVVGNWYWRGMYGIKQDPAEAVKWYRKAAEQGNPYAQSNLGEAYYNGEGVEKNQEEAVKWYRKAAEQGNPTAQYNLGAVYFNGEGVEKNQEEAVKWILKAAENGSNHAQKTVEELSRSGLIGTDKNPAKAAEMDKKAAEQGNSNDSAEEYYQKGIHYLISSSTEELGIRYLQKAAKKGHVKAQCRLGHIACSDNYEDEAFKWFKMAADLGDAEGLYEVGECYDYGRGVARDKSEAIKFYQQSSEKGNGDASYKLARLYDPNENKDSNAVNTDKATAFQFYKKAAEQGNPYGQLYLAHCYEKGIFVEKNDTEAFNLYVKSESGLLATSPRAEAICKQGEFLLEGRGCEKNEQKAVNYLKRAAKEGSSDANYLLYKCYSAGKGVEKDTQKADNYFNSIWEISDPDLAFNYAKSGLFICMELFLQKKTSDSKKLAQSVLFHYAKAANAGNKEAARMMYYFYRLGKGDEDYSYLFVKANAEIARKWLLKAAENGDKDSQFEIGEKYLEEKRDSQALHWFRKAAEQGHEKAKEYVDVLED